MRTVRFIITDAFCLIALALTVVVGVAIALFFTGHRDIAAFAGIEGTLLVLLGAILHAVIDSRKRWPDKNWFLRLGKIMWLER